MGSCCITQGTQPGALWQHRGWNGVGGGKEVQEGGELCILNGWFTFYGRKQHCKAIILQLKGKKRKLCLPKWPYHFALPTAINLFSCCSISHLAFGVVSVLGFGHYKRCEIIVTSHRSFNLQFPSLVVQTVKNLPARQETSVLYLGQEDPMKEVMATHFSILAWRIPWTEEPGGLQFMGWESQTQLSN